MLGKKQNAMIIICANIITLLIIYLGIIAINFFTEEEIVTKKTIVGINPITKTSMFYQEPLTIAIEEEKQEVKEQQVMNSKIKETEANKQQVEVEPEIIVENIVENAPNVEVKETIPTRIQRL